MMEPLYAGPTPLQLQEELPERLLYALERRWYEGFDSSHAPIARHPGGDVRAGSRFLRVLKLVHGEDVGQSLHLLNMQNVLSTFRDGSHSIGFALRGNGADVRMYMGVRSTTSAQAVQTADYVDVLARALRSNFPGIALAEQDVSFEECLENMLYPISESRYLACVTGIPSLKRDAQIYFTQSQDRLIDALRGEAYTLLVLAEPMPEAILLELVRRCRHLSEDISAQVRQSVAVSQGQSRGTSDMATEGVSFGAGTSALLGMLFSASYGQSSSRSQSRQRGETAGVSVTQERLNKTAEFCETLLDYYLGRLQGGRNAGFWNVGLYLASNDYNTLLRAQGVVRGLYSGQDTHFEPLRVLDLQHVEARAKEALYSLRNPGLDTGAELWHPLGREFQKLSTPMTTEELSILLSLPRREVPGFKLSPMADFGLNPPSTQGISLGNVLYRGERLADEVVIPSRHLTRHTFVTGVTGAGKTNTCLALLRAVHQRGVPFLVIEPAKTEYRALLADPDLGKDLWVFTLGDEGADSSPFRLNPFEFAYRPPPSESTAAETADGKTQEPIARSGFPLLTHIDLLKAVFNAAFPMYASMPFILEDAIMECYVERGWDIATSTNRYLPAGGTDIGPYLPRLQDLYDKIDEVVASKQYAQQLTMDISAALKARLKSLLNGGKGRMLNVPRSIPFADLLSRPTVLELRRMGDDEERAFIMALLLVRLFEHREQGGAAGDLVHLTLIEEAHRLLRNVPTALSAESASARGKSVEMFTDMLAEVREYGEGIVIVDQIPSKLAPDVVKNTNLKVLHKVLAQDDRDFVGNTMNLTEFQKGHVVRLQPGQAVVHTEGLDSPTLVQVHKLKDGLRERFQQQENDGRTVSVRMGRIRKEVPTSFHRYVGCSFCDDPCRYYSDQYTLGSKGLAQFWRLYAALRYSPIEDISPIWQNVRAQLERALGGLRGSRAAMRGTLLCQLVQLAEITAQQMYDYYRRGGAGFDGLVGTQDALCHVLGLLVEGKGEDAIGPASLKFRRMLATTLAGTPATETVGCQLCGRRCAYGFDVQERLKGSKEALDRAIVTVAQDPGSSGQYGALVRVVQKHAAKHAGVPVDPGHSAHLGYCWLANTTNRHRVLRRFQAMVVASAHAAMAMEG